MPRLNETVVQALPMEGDLLAGKYRVERLLGTGGMGAVFAANHELLSQRVAVKVLLADVVSDKDAVARFLNEARAAAKIQSEHCARVMDVGTLDGGQPYMVMEYLEGHDLAQLLERDGPLAINHAVDFVLQALEALAHAHALHIVHRDLKPANLFLARQQDGTDIIKILDFGISKTIGGPGGPVHALTSTKTMLGTPLYMSPEQFRSAKNVDPRTDIWSLGVILYELLTGKVPFDGGNVGELLTTILEQDPPSVRSLRPDVPADLDRAVRRCLAREPDRRYADVAQLAEALAPFGSPAGSTSVERIRRSIATLTGDSRAARPAAQDNRPLAAAGAPGHQTASAWGDARAAGRGMGKGSILGVAFIVAAVGVGTGVFFISRSTTPSVSTPAGPSAVVSIDAAPPVQGSSVATAPPAPVASATTTSPATLPVATPPPPPTKAAAPPRKAGPKSAPTAYDPTKDPSAQ